MKPNVQPVISLKLNTMSTPNRNHWLCLTLSKLQHATEVFRSTTICCLSFELWHLKYAKQNKQKENNKKTTKAKNQSPKVSTLSSSSVNRSQKKTPSTLHRHFYLKLCHLNSYGKLLISKILLALRYKILLCGYYSSRTGGLEYCYSWRK